VCLFLTTSGGGFRLVLISKANRPLNLIYFHLCIGTKNFTRAAMSLTSTSVSVFKAYLRGWSMRVGMEISKTNYGLEYKENVTNDYKFR
jgi:hypothetical protein